MTATTDTTTRPKRRILPPDQRKRMILAAALDVFSRYGYEKSDVDKIARRAGIGKGTIYRHFASKEALFLALVDSGFQSLQEYMYAEKLDQASFQERLTRGMKLNVNFFVENPKFYRVLMMEPPTHRSRLRDNIIERHRRYIGPLVTAIRRAVHAGKLKRIDPEFAAFSLIAMSWVVTERYLLGGKDTCKKDVETAIDLFLNGVSK